MFKKNTKVELDAKLDLLEIKDRLNSSTDVGSNNLASMDFKMVC